MINLSKELPCNKTDKKNADKQLRILSNYKKEEYT